MTGVISPSFIAADVVEVVIRLLSEESGEPEAEVREQLEEVGLEMPIDSLLIVEILTRVEEAFGMRIPATPEAARSMRSVWSFAEMVVTAARGDERSSGHERDA